MVLVSDLYPPKPVGSTILPTLAHVAVPERLQPPIDHLGAYLVGLPRIGSGSCLRRALYAVVVTVGLVGLPLGRHGLVVIGAHLLVGRDALRSLVPRGGAPLKGGNRFSDNASDLVKRFKLNSSGYFGTKGAGGGA